MHTQMYTHTHVAGHFRDCPHAATVRATCMACKQCVIQRLEILAFDRFTPLEVDICQNEGQKLLAAQA